MRISFCQKKKKITPTASQKEIHSHFHFAPFLRHVFSRALFLLLGRFLIPQNFSFSPYYPFIILTIVYSFHSLATYLWTVFQVSWEFSSTDSKAFAILLRNGISEGDLIISMTIVIYIAWLKWTLLTFILWEVLQL